MLADYVFECAVECAFECADGGPEPGTKSLEWILELVQGCDWMFLMEKRIGGLEAECALKVPLNALCMRLECPFRCAFGCALNGLVNASQSAFACTLHAFLHAP